MPLKQSFNREYLKTKIGEENIFTHYFGNWDYGNSYSSVFREDERNSTGFYLSKSDSVIYNDLRTGDKYDFVHFVMKKYGLNYYAALKQIAIDFGLSKGEPTNNKIAVIKAGQTPKKHYTKAFIIKATKFKKQHIDYWLQYGITIEELKAAKIYAVENFTVNEFDDKRILINTFTSPANNELKFAYTYEKDDEMYVKIYTPYNKDYKWFGDVSLNTPFGLNDLLFANDTLIITKSVKDCLVLRKFFPEVIGLQNESSGAMEAKLALTLKKLYKNIIIWFDCDRAGLLAANYYKKTYGFKPVYIGSDSKNIWQNIMNAKQKHIKDPADFVKLYGLDVFKQYLQYLKLI